ncbi:cytochrome P450 [Halobaculum sp. MBLA0147]|uniref:cytochrome P450 n=1 Tax=Halobaculum sp. MBLA0147 TaxID=3079934 RepID=UPI003524ABC8
MTQTPLDAFPPELSTPDRRLRPGPVYASLHDEGPVRYDETRECWDVVGHAAVERVAADPERFSSRPATDPANDPLDGSTLLGESLLHVDPPRHERLRSVVDEWFRPSELDPLRSFVTTRADELLDTALTEGDSLGSDAADAGGHGEARFDLVSAFAYPLTVATLAELLGVPTSEREAFSEWTRFTATAPHEPSDPGALRSRLQTYLGELVDGERDAEDSDVLRVIRAATDRSTTERRSLATVILLGGLSTTHLIDNAIWSLAEADALARVRGDDDAVQAAVEETLRHRSPVRAAARYATTETELAGHTVAAGDHLCLWFGAANRDPSVFAAPAEFDLDRNPSRHVAFGHGLHYCLGAALARLVARVALTRLLARCEPLTVHTDELEPTGSMLVYGPSILPVTVGRST